MIQSVFLFATFVTGDWWLGNSRLSHRHFERKREIFVIYGETGHERNAQTGNLLSQSLRIAMIYTPRRF